MFTPVLTPLKLPSRAVGRLRKYNLHGCPDNNFPSSNSLPQSLLTPIAVTKTFPCVSLGISCSHSLIEAN